MWTTDVGWRPHVDQLVVCFGVFKTRHLGLRGSRSAHLSIRLAQYTRCVDPVGFGRLSPYVEWGEGEIVLVLRKEQEEKYRGSYRRAPATLRSVAGNTPDFKWGSGRKPQASIASTDELFSAALQEAVTEGSWRVLTPHVSLEQTPLPSWLDETCRKAAVCPCNLMR